MGTLNSVIKAYGDQISSSAYEFIIVELSTLIQLFIPLIYLLVALFLFRFHLNVISTHTKYLCLASDSELHMTALALELCCTLMADRKSTPNVGLTVKNKVLPQALTIVRSSLLQGQALAVLHNTSGSYVLIGFFLYPDS